MDGVRRNQPLLSLHGPKRSRSSAECLKPQKPGLDFLPFSFWRALPLPALPAKINMTSDGKDYEHGCAQASQTERRDLCGSHKETITGSDRVWGSALWNPLSSPHSGDLLDMAAFHLPAKLSGSFLLSILSLCGWFSNSNGAQLFHKYPPVSLGTLGEKHRTCEVLILRMPQRGDSLQRITQAIRQFYIIKG